MSSRRNPLPNSTMAKMFSDRKETGDIKFIVERKVVPAHRCVLAALSPEYEEKLYGSQPNKVFDLTNVSAAAFEEFLQFYYMEKVILTTENIGKVLNLTIQSLVEDFINECVMFLVETLTVENTCTTYRLAITYNIEKLKELCEVMISENTRDILNTEDFINCDIRVLISVLKLGSLYCTETEIFEACIAWAQTACRKRDVDVDDMQNLRAELGDAFYEIRFGSMTHEEYAKIHKSYDGLFSTDEFMEIFYMIGKLDGFKAKQFKKTPRYRNVLNPHRSFSIKQKKSTKNVGRKGG